MGISCGSRCRGQHWQVVKVTGVFKGCGALVGLFSLVRIAEKQVGGMWGGFLRGGGS